jgi:succinate dehydrogenase/fumarate reductase-like Fe-S protein
MRKDSLHTMLRLCTMMVSRVHGKAKGHAYWHTYEVDQEKLMTIVGMILTIVKNNQL